MVSTRRIQAHRLALTLTLVLLSFAASSQAIVIRHDRPDARYQKLAADYPAAVSLRPDGAGVLVAPDWVLTAAHVTRGISRSDPRVQIGDAQIPVVRIFEHPDWQGHGAHDMALVQLASPIEHVEPARLYEADDEVDQVVTFVGSGDFGTGETGPKQADGRRRAATNRVESADADWIYFTFDQGREATDLEGVSGPGDSGGPALITRDGVVWTLGVSVFSMGDGQGPGKYGVREGYARVSTHLPWLRSVLEGNSETPGYAPGEATATSPAEEAEMILGGEGSAQIPDTAAGRLVNSYIEAYNHADPARMRTLMEDSYSVSYRKHRTEEEHRQLHQRLRQEILGKIELVQVADVSDEAIAVLFDTTLGGLAEFRFTFAGESDLKIDGIRVAKVSID